MAALPKAFYDRPTLEVAADLLGMVLVHRPPGSLTAGRIVEVEAYIGEGDPACHAAAGPTRRNAPLYGPPGLAYVYLNYGIHFLFNVVTEAEGRPAAVLIRALEPIEGLDVMRARRAPDRSGREVPGHELCRGPGSLTRAMGITLADNLADLTRPRLCVEDRGAGPPRASIVWTPRIGISAGTDRRWRCYVKGSAAVSGTPRHRT